MSSVYTTIEQLFREYGVFSAGTYTQLLICRYESCGNWKEHQYNNITANELEIRDIYMVELENVLLKDALCLSTKR